MNSIYLAYAVPPLLGAFIGYLTNKVAIRMLFRPLKTWRVFGIRVPMTPGVIPSKRHALAGNIGEMVGRHLLTSREIGTALSEERFQDHLYYLVDDRLNELFSRELGPVPKLIPERFQTYFKVGIRTVKYQFRSGVHRYLQSSEFEERVSETVLDQLQSFGAKPLNDLLSPGERESFYGVIDSLVGDLLAGQEIEKWLAEYLEETFKQSAAEGKAIADFLPQPLHELILDIIRSHSPEILHQLARMLSEPPVRDRIIKAVRGGIDDFIESLGPVGAMAGSFLDMGALEDKIREYLSDNKESIASWLENPEVQRRFSSVLVEQTTRYLDMPLSDILERVNDEKLGHICRQISVQVFGVLRSKGVAETLSTMLRNNLEKMLRYGQRSVADITSQFLSMQTSDALKKTITVEIVVLLRSQRVCKLLDNMMNSMFDSFLNKPAGVLHNILPARIRAGFTEYIVLIINRILLREVPSLVESLNILQIVTEKVDSLDLLRLEGLLLSIMEEQFKYINLFGALLGFLIGLINLVIMQFT